MTFLCLTLGILCPLPALEPVKPIVKDTREAEVRNFLEKFHSHLASEAGTFVKVADWYNLDYHLLPVVSCVESSCGKNYRYNAFGWGSDGKDYDYGEDREDIKEIGKRIAKLSYYQKYHVTKDLRDFAEAYNKPYAKSYHQKLLWFLGQW